MALDTKQMSEDLIKARGIRNRMPVEEDPYARFGAGTDPYQMSQEEINARNLRDSLGDRTGPFEVPVWAQSERTTEDPTVQAQEYRADQIQENQQGWAEQPRQETENAFVPGVAYEPWLVEGPVDTTVYGPLPFIEGPLPWLTEPLQAPKLFPAMVPSWERR